MFMSSIKKSIFIILIAAFYFVTATPVFALTDKNGTNVTGWTEVRKNYIADIALDGVVKHGGNYSLRLSSNTVKNASNNYLNLYTNVPVQKGKTYEFGCWVKADGASDAYMYFDSAMNLITPFTKTFEWTKFKFTYTYTGENSTGKQMGFMFYNKMGAIWIDEAYICEVDDDGNPSPVNLMSNGSFETGTPTAVSNDMVSKVGNVEELVEDDAYSYLTHATEIPLRKVSGITVDASEDDWESIQGIKLNEYYRFGTYSGDIPVRATYKIAYDDNYFYFLVKALDPVHNTDTAYYWQADSIQVMLSKKTGEFGTEVGFMHVENGEPYCTHDNIQFKSSRDNTETLYEVAIPWGSYIPSEPSAFSFNIMLNENNGTDRCYALEIAQGIGNGKTAVYSPTLIPQSEGENSYFAFIDGDEEIMTNKDCEYNTIIVNFGNTMKGEMLNANRVKIADFTVPAGKVSKIPFVYSASGMGNVEVRAIVRTVYGENELSYSANAVPSYELFNELDEKYTARIVGIRELAKKCNEQGIETVYENTDLNAAERSLEVMCKNVENGDYSIVAYNLNEIPKILDAAESDLKAYLTNSKQQKQVPKYIAGKTELEGMSFTADTEYNGASERRPMFFLGYNTGWEDRDDIPNYSDFGIGFIPINSVFSDVLGEAGKPGVWKSQGGSAGWADADIIVTDKEAYEGEHSLKMVNRTKATANITQYIYQNIAAKPDTKYTFGGVVKGKNIKQCSMSFNGQRVTFNSNYDDWTPFSATTKTAADLNSKVLCFIGTSDITEEIYIDDVYLYEEGSDKNLLENGDFESFFEQSGDSLFGIDNSALDKVEAKVRRAEFYNIPVILSPGIPSAPDYLFRVADDVAQRDANYSVYLKFNPTHPYAMQATEIYLRALAERMKDHDNIVVFDLHNEPRFDSSDKAYYLPQYRQYLMDKYGNIDALNAKYGTEYTSFDDIQMPKASSRDVYYNDWRVFNESIYTSFYKMMHDTVKSVDPNIKIMAKCMLDIYRYPANTLNRGINYEDLSQYFDIAGDDAWAYIGQNNETVQAKLEWYDLTGSLTDAPVINSEDHIIIDNAVVNFDPNQVKWTRTNIWQGIVHGLAADNTWLWGISDQMEKGLFRNPTYQYRVDCMSAIPRLAYDANRYSYELEALKQKPREVALLYSHPSICYNSQYMNSLYMAYTETIYNGLKPGFIGEKQIDKLANYGVLIVPEATNVTEAAVRAIADFAENGGKVYVIGDESLRRNENNEPIPEELITRLENTAVFVPAERKDGAIISSASDVYPTVLEKAFDDLGMKKLVVYEAATGQKVSDTEWEWTEYNGSLIINICNYDWDSTKDVYIEYNGERMNKITELRESVQLGGVFSIKPYEPLFIRATKE